MDAKTLKAIAEAWQEVTEKKAKLDPVDKDELKGKHDDRDDKDIDNDGDVDSSDQFLHKKRKAIGKAMKNDKSADDLGEAKIPADQLVKLRKEYGKIDKINPTGPAYKKMKALIKSMDKDQLRGMALAKIKWLSQTAASELRYTHNIKMKANEYMPEGTDEMTPCPKCDGSMDNHDPDCPHAEASEKKKAAQETKEDLDAKEVGKALSHDCAKHVASESWGYGETIAGQHTIVESADGEGVVTHYDVMFEHGIEMDVPVENLAVLVSEKHLHAAKTKLKASCNKEETEVEEAAKTAKESVEEGTVAELNQEVETSYVGKGKSMYDAIQQVWEAAAQAKQGIAGKHQEKQKGDPQRHGQSQQMIADTDYDNPEVAADFKVGTDDVSKAGRVVTKQSPARGGADQLNVGDKKPVKGAK